MNLLSGSAKTGASSGGTFTLNLSGATQTTSGKIPGAKYFFDPIINRSKRLFQVIDNLKQCSYECRA